MIDENSSDQPDFKVPANVESMVACYEPGSASIDAFWGCPVCLTDDYLIDITNKEQL